ncbi:MAG: FtsQ-type POTRA domain-containing protein [Chloroflexi bacterium]|nr:FtsQ-type POTRA domain-containing protein [Chloroflexota bacterium]
MGRSPSSTPQHPYLGWRSQRPAATPPPQDREERRGGRGFWGRLAVAFCRVTAVLLGIAIAVVLYTVPVLAVTRVEVSGNARLSRETIVDLAGVQGRNLLALDLPGAQARLLTNPWVRSATARRRLPATVAITIEERQPAAIWQTGGDRYLMADDGTLVEPAPLASALPTILDLDQAPQEVGGRVPPGPAALAQELLRALPQAGDDAVVGFEYRATEGLTAVTAGGLRVVFGNGSDLAYQLATYRAILAQVRQEQLPVREIDVRFGARPVLRP